MILIAGPASSYLAEKLAPLLGIKLMNIEHKLFPDGESYIRFAEDVSGEDLLVVQGTHPPQDRHLMQAFLIADAALDLGARSISLICPYLAYARQSRRFLEGEAISSKTVLKLLHESGYRRVYTVNVHSPSIAEGMLIQLIDIRAEKALADHLKKMSLESPIIVSVGKGGKEMANALAREMKTEYAVAISKRDRVTGEVSIEIEKISAETAIVVDDIISTGGTMAKLIKALKEMEVKRVYATCIHALLIGEAVKKILDAGAERIIASDTIPNKYAEYTVAGVIAERLRREL